VTLIAGFVCSDGIVLAADSASSDSDTFTKQPTTKIKRLGNQRMLYGGSGDVGLIQKIDQALDGFTIPGNMKRVRQDLRQRIVPELQEAARFHAPYPAQGYNVPPSASFLFAFACAGQPCLLEIEKDGRDTIYGATLGNFAAIGSGKPWAQAIFRPFLFKERNIELGKVFAYRVLHDAIDLASYGLAAPVRIWTLPTAGDPSLVSDEEMGKLQTTREIWQALEAEALGKLLQPLPAPAPVDEPIPSPNTQAAADPPAS